VTIFDKDNQVIAASDYVFNPAHDYQSLAPIATLAFTSDQAHQEPLTVRAKGAQAGGVLIDNPVEVAVDFLTRWVGLEPTEIDPTWRSRTAAYLAGLGVKAAGVLAEDVRPDQFLSQLLRLMASWWRAGSGKVVFRPHLGSGGLLNSDVAAHLTPQSLDLERLKVTWDEDQICTRAAIKYAYNPAAADFDEYDDGQAQAALDQESRYRTSYLRLFELPWVRDAVSVAKLQGLVVQNYARPPATLSARLPGYGFLHLEQGDVVGLSVNCLLDEDLKPLRNQLFRLTSVKVGLDPGSVTEIEAFDLGAWLTTAERADGGQAASGAVLAGGQRDRELHA
jgi:hypothetical protein